LYLTNYGVTKLDKKGPALFLKANPGRRNKQKRGIQMNYPIYFTTANEQSKVVHSKEPRSPHISWHISRNTKDQSQCYLWRPSSTLTFSKWNIRFDCHIIVMPKQWSRVALVGEKSKSIWISMYYRKKQFVLLVCTVDIVTVNAWQFVKTQKM
jgi:hypothetical protein